MRKPEPSPAKRDTAAHKNAVEDQEDVKKREAEQHQQPVPMSGDPPITEYEKPLPQPGDKDYVAGQPVDEAEADKTEKEVKQRMEDAKERQAEAEKAREANQKAQTHGQKHHRE